MKSRADTRFRRQESQDLPPPSYDQPSPDNFRSPSRSRSRSPPLGRQPKHAQRAVPQRGEPVKRAEQSYSTSGSSYDSQSGSSSSSEGAQRPPAKAQARHGQTAAPRKKDAPTSATTSLKREREFAARIQSLEDQLSTERAAREELAAKSSFLTEKVRSVAERSKARGSMLVRLLGATRKVEEAKSQLEESKLRLTEAELELKRITAEVTAAVAEESAPAGATSARERGDGNVDADTRNTATGRPGAQEAGDSLAHGSNGQPTTGGAPAAMAPDALDGRDDTAGPVGAGGWQEVQDPNQAGAGNKFRPFKFSIKL